MNTNCISIIRTLFALLFLIQPYVKTNSAFAQNMGINTNNSSPNTAAILDIDAAPNFNKGLLIPRVTFSQRTTGFNTLSEAAKGLTVYQTDAGGFGEGFYYNTSTSTTPIWSFLLNNTSGWSLTGNALTTPSNSVIGTAITAGQNYVGTSDLKDFVLATNNLERLRISSAGNIGIGTSTPGTLLDVNGSTRAFLYTFPALTGDPAPIITARTVPAGQGASSEKTELILFHSNDPANAAGADQITLRAPALSFQTFNDVNVLDINNNVGYNERMYINSIGNVGIGTTTPATKLDLYNGTAWFHTSGGANQTNLQLGEFQDVPSIALYSFSTDDVTGDLLNIISNRYQGNIFFKRQSSGGVRNMAEIFSGSNGSYFQLYGPDADNTVKIRLDANGSSYLIGGNVGIGTNSPATTLDVNGVINSAAGYRIANAAATGNYLRGNGTNFVSSAIQAADLPSGAGNYIQNQTAADQAAGFRINGNGLFNGGQITMGTATPLANTLLTANTSATYTTGIGMTLSGGVGTGINVTSASSSYNNITSTNSGNAAATYYAVGGLLTSATLSGASTFAKGYLGYKANGSSNVAANYFAGYFQGKTAITSSSSPDGIADLEVQNTTSGAAPATVFLRQTTSLTTTANVLNNLNFGDNHSTSPQAQIQVIRGAAGGASDLPTDMAFSTTPDASATLTERMRIMNNGNVGIGTTAPAYKLDVAGDINLTGALRIGAAAGTVGQVLTSAAGGANTWTTPASGTITAITGTAPIVSSGGNTPAISITQSGTAANGFLSSTDWNTFNNKPGGSGTTNYLARWTSSTALGIGATFDNGTNVGIGTTAPVVKLQVQGGDIRIGQPSGTRPYLDMVQDGVKQWGLVNPASTTRFSIVEDGATGNERLTVLLGGNVGIGTTAPGYKLHVAGATDILNVQGSTNAFYRATNKIGAGAATGDFSFGVDDGSGAGANAYIIYDRINSAYRFTINNAGNLGIGTTTPTTKLDIAGTILSRGELHFSSNPATIARWRVTATGNDLSIGMLTTAGSGGGNNFVFNSSTAPQVDRLFGQNSGVNWFVIDNNIQSVGIGTTSPGAKLEIAGQIKITGGAPGAGKVLTSDALGLATWTTPTTGGSLTSVTGTAPIVSSGGNTPAISITQAGTAANGFLSSTDWNTFNNKLAGTGTTNYLARWTSATALGIGATFDNGTNVGIGTAVPTEKVTISGGGGVLGLYGTGLDGSTYQRFTTYVDATYGLLFEAPAPGNLLANRYNYNFSWRGGGNGMFIKGSTGNVGIGTATPVAKLHVNGLVRMGSETGTSETPQYPDNSDGGIVIRRLYTTNTSAGSIAARTSTLTFERNGSNGGFQINRSGTNSLQVCNCTGVSSSGANVNVALNNLAAGITVVYTNAQNLVFINCMFGDPYYAGDGHTTEVRLIREFNDYFWFGTVTSTFNQ